MGTLPSSRTATDDAGRLEAAERITGAAQQLVRSEDLEEVLTVAAVAIGDALDGDAVLRVAAGQHDLHVGGSGVVPPSALSPSVRAALSVPDAPDTSDAIEQPGLLLASTGHHATCRAWVGGIRRIDLGASERTVAQLLLHSLAQSVDRIVMVDRHRESAANLERAVESHRLVGQAMGILIERHRIVSEKAFDVLRRASQHHNVKLREIARRVVETGAEPDEVV